MYTPTALYTPPTALPQTQSCFTHHIVCPTRPYPHASAGRWLAVAVLIAGYVHDQEDFLRDPTWDKFPFVIELIASLPRSGSVLQAVMGHFISEMWSNLDQWYAHDQHVHTALELWGQLDIQTPPVGDPYCGNQCLCFGVAINVCVLVSVLCLQVRMDRRTWYFMASSPARNLVSGARRIAPPARTIPVATFFLAHLVNTYLADPTSTAVWRKLVTTKVTPKAAEQCTEVAPKAAAKRGGRQTTTTSLVVQLLNESAVQVQKKASDNLDREHAMVMVALELVAARQKIPAGQPVGAQHPLKSC